MSKRDKNQNDATAHDPDPLVPERMDTEIGRYAIGDKVVIRGIPYHYIGVIEEFGKYAVKLAPNAVWLADSARWGSDFLVNGKVNEAEPYCDGVWVRYSVIADVTAWRHALPKQT
jgi:hypothetical protein